MAQKIARNGRISYICENCGAKMFAVIKDTHDLVDEKNLSVFKKHLNTKGSDGPSYTCQFCKTVHRGYYINSGYRLDFRPLKISNNMELSK